MPAAPWAKARFLWLFGQKMDLAFLFLPAILAPLLFIFSQTNQLAQTTLWGLVVLNAFGLGDFHVGITWLNYLERNNLDYYTSSGAKKAIYFLGPIAIVLLSVAGAFVLPGIVAAVYMVWSVQHICQQNVGLLLLYHNHGQNEAIVNRQLEVRSLQLGAVFFSILFAQRMFLIELAKFPFWKAIVVVAGLAFAFTIWLYLRELIVQISRGAYLNAPAFLFWCLSIYIFAPFAFLGKSYGDAILIANTMHWAQYVGIMFLLCRRKYQGEQLKAIPFAHPILLFFVFGISMIALLDFIRALPYAIFHDCLWLTTAVVGIVAGVGMVHYYQDAFMWRFREPFYQEPVLSYLRSKN